MKLSDIFDIPELNMVFSTLRRTPRTKSYHFVRYVSHNFVRHVSNMALCQTFHFYPSVVNLSLLLHFSESSPVKLNAGMLSSGIKYSDLASATRSRLHVSKMAYPRVTFGKMVLLLFISSSAYLNASLQSENRRNICDAT